MLISSLNRCEKNKKIINHLTLWKRLNLMLQRKVATLLLEFNKLCAKGNILIQQHHHP